MVGETVSVGAFSRQYFFPFFNRLQCDGMLLDIKWVILLSRIDIFFHWPKDILTSIRQL